MRNIRQVFFIVCFCVYLIALGMYSPVLRSYHLATILLTRAYKPFFTWYTSTVSTSVMTTWSSTNPDSRMCLYNIQRNWLLSLGYSFHPKWYEGFSFSHNLKKINRMLLDRLSYILSFRRRPCCSDSTVCPFHCCSRCCFCRRRRWYFCINSSSCSCSRFSVRRSSSRSKHCLHFFWSWTIL